MYQENTGKDINALTGYEVHAQVAFVFSYLNKLSDIRRAYVYWKYGNKLERKVCSKEILDKGTMNVPNMFSNKEECIKAMSCYTVREISKRCNISTRQSWKAKNKFLDYIEPIVSNVMIDMEDWLQFQVKNT